jgi:hypothetical protein
LRGQDTSYELAKKECVLLLDTFGRQAGTQAGRKRTRNAMEMVCNFNHALKYNGLSLESLEHDQRYE